jgi:hypothetical protein
MFSHSKISYLKIHGGNDQQVFTQIDLYATICLHPLQSSFFTSEIKAAAP